MPQSTRTSPSPATSTNRGDANSVDVGAVERLGHDAADPRTFITSEQNVVPEARAPVIREVDGIRIAHHAIDAGAALILGHHAHILKGIEVYRGRAIFYSLGNFAVDLRMTVIARAAFERDGRCAVTVLPAYISDDAQPEVVHAGDDRFDRVVEYLRWCCRDQGLDVRLVPDGDAVRIEVE